MILRNPWQYIEEKQNITILNFVSFWLICAIILSFFWWYYFSYIIRINFYIFLTIYLVLFIFVIICLYLIYKKVDNEIKNYNKWLIWEKEVAYQLNLLQAKHSNLYILNDYQLSFDNKKRNIDHIIICEKWIFTIETKNYKNIFENDKQKAIKQARKEALALKNELEKEFKIKWVIPILTFIWKNIKESNQIEKIVAPDGIESVINNSNQDISSLNTKNIFLYLNSLQQQKAD